MNSTKSLKTPTLNDLMSMKHTIPFSKFLIDLTNIPSRRGCGEQQAATLIKKYLTDMELQYDTQEFDTIIPITKKAVLYADGIKIPCVGASFVSGLITNESVIVSTTEQDTKTSCIIYNPLSIGMCIQSHKQYPAVAVNKDSISKLTTATKIQGEVIVDEFKFTSQNILVGNNINPEIIVFAHYDSLIGTGALDNAGSVDVVYQTIISNKALLAKILFVFIGSEEESISSSEGFYGFKMFDEKYSMLLDNTKKVIVLDGVGIGMASLISKGIDWVFDVNSRTEKIYSKVLWMQNDQTQVMRYYHTVFDTLEVLDQKYLNQAKDLLIHELIK